MFRYSVEGVVIKNLNYKDSDKIYTIFTKNKGKISASAKGVRKISSRRAGNLDTLNYVVIGIFEGSFGYKTITEVKTLNSFRKLKSSIPKVSKAYFLLELVHKFLEEDHEEEKIFNLLISSLEKMEEDDKNIDFWVLFFEISLLILLGYGLTFEKCKICGREYSDSWEAYKFNYGLGGLVCDRCDGGFVISRGSSYVLNNVRSGKLSDKFLHKEILESDRILKTYISFILNSEIRSTTIFNALENY